MTTPKRTLEEIAHGLWVRDEIGALSEEQFLTALREAADAPSRQIADEARHEEREALRERLAGDVEHWKSESQKGPIPWSSNCDGSAHEARNLLAWLDARSLHEEPKP